MRKDKEWGDGIMIEVASEYYKHSIIVHYPDGRQIIINKQPNNASLNIGYINNNHYLSLIKSQSIDTTSIIHNVNDVKQSSKSLQSSLLNDQQNHNKETVKNTILHSKRKTFSSKISEVKINKLNVKSNQRYYLQTWENKWTWLSYNGETDTVICSICQKADQMNLISFDRLRDAAFISRGFNNWKKGPFKFKIHEKSNCHKESLQKLTFVSLMPPVHVQLNTQIEAEQIIAQQALMAIITSLRFLAANNIAMRGHSHENGNFIELLQLRSNDIPALKQWLESKKNHSWTSFQVQNEIVELMAHNLQRQLLEKINKSPYFGLVADGTTDDSGIEQFSINIRYINVETFEVHDAFMGMYNPASCSADDLTAAIKDVLIRFNIPISKLRGHSFDGASNMCGRFNGVQAQLTRLQPQSVFVHCSNHSLDLALQEVACETSTVRDSLSFVKDCANIFRESAKRKQILEEIANDLSILDGSETSNLLALCPTRWCVRSQAISKILKMWKPIIFALDEIKNEAIKIDMKSKVIGIRKKMSTMEAYFGINLCKLLFSPCEELAKVLQKENITATGAFESAGVLISHLRRLREENEFDRLYDQCINDAINLNLDLPKKLRTLQPPTKYESHPKTSKGHFFTAKEKLKQEYFSATDLLISEIERRFDQPGLKQMVKLEDILYTSLNFSKTTFIKSDEFLNKVDKICDIYSDIDQEKLKCQLLMLPDLVKDCVPLPINVVQLASYISDKPVVVYNLFSEVIKLVSILLVVPATVANAERSFSGIRRIKTWLRRTMTQKRLTHLALTNFHKDLLLQMDMNILANEFVSRTQERRMIFGNINIATKHYI